MNRTFRFKIGKLQLTTRDKNIAKIYKSLVRISKRHAPAARLIPYASRLEMWLTAFADAHGLEADDSRICDLFDLLREIYDAVMTRTENPEADDIDKTLLVRAARELMALDAACNTDSDEDDGEIDTEVDFDLDFDDRYGDCAEHDDEDDEDEDGDDEDGEETEEANPEGKADPEEEANPERDAAGDAPDRRTCTKTFRFPDIALKITLHHEIRDMSVPIYRNYTNQIPVDQLTGKEELVNPVPFCGTIRLISLNENRIELGWAGKIFAIDFGQTVRSQQIAEDNPQVSFEGISMTFEYADFADFDHTAADIIHIGEMHKRSRESIYPKTAEMEARLLFQIDKLIEGGDTELYVLRALLSASNNWSTFVIVRMEQFRELLLEGIDKGCLAPDHKYDWGIMEMAATNNDPEEFMTDMERYYDLLATAAEAGIDTARDIMNRIWEPEQIIEED